MIAKYGIFLLLVLLFCVVITTGGKGWTGRSLSKKKVRFLSTTSERIYDKNTGEILEEKEGEMS